MPKAFITGATGFLGHHLLTHLLAQGYTLTALVRTFEQARRFPNTLQVFPGDVTQRETIRRAMRGAEVVFHLATTRPLSPTPKETARIYKVNIEGTRNVLELAAELNIPRIVHVSDLAAYGPPRIAPIDETASPALLKRLPSLYANAKQQAHFAVAAALQARGVPISIVCPGTLFGPGDASLVGVLVRRLQQRKLWLGFRDKAVRHWTYAPAVAAGLRLVAERGAAGETYFLAGPALTLAQFFAVGHTAGLPQPLTWWPYGVLTGFVQFVRRIYPRWVARIPGLPPSAPLTNSLKAAQTLGWQAPSVAEGWQQYLATK